MNGIGWARISHIMLRIAAGLFFMMHGGQKVLGWFGGMGGEGGTAPLISLLGLASVLELVGGVAVALGLLTRPVAFVLSGEMTVAYFMAHVSRGGIWPIPNGGEPAALFCFIFFFMAFNGSGGFSLDEVLSRRRVPARTDTRVGSPA